MARPPLPLGAWGKIKRTRLGPDRWEARARYRDLDGVTRTVRKRTPLHVTDKVGAVAQDELVKELVCRAAPAGETITRDTRLAALWVARREQLRQDGMTQGTLDDYDYLWVGLGKAVGGLPVGEATTQKLDAVLRSMATHRTQSVAVKMKAILSGMMGLAVRYGALDANPMAEVRLAKGVAKKQPKALTPDAVVDLATAVYESSLPCPIVMSPAQAARRNGRGQKVEVPTVAAYCAAMDLADVIVMFMGTGCRIGEVLGFRWEDVDLVSETVTVAGKLNSLKAEGLVWEPFTKTEGGTGTVLRLPKFAVKMLQDRDRVGPMVFPRADREFRDPEYVAIQWRRVRAALNVEWVTSHTFRRSVATILDGEGLTARQAADQLHSRVSTTQDSYFGRSDPDGVAAAALDRALGG